MEVCLITGTGFVMLVRKENVELPYVVTASLRKKQPEARS